MRVLSQGEIDNLLSSLLTDSSILPVSGVAPETAAPAASAPAAPMFQFQAPKPTENK